MLLYNSLRTRAGTWSEIFIKTPYGSGVARLTLDPLAYWVMTSDMADRAILERIQEKKLAEGLDERKALIQALIEASIRYPTGAPNGTPSKADDDDSRKAVA